MVGELPLEPGVVAVVLRGFVLLVPKADVQLRTKTPVLVARGGRSRRWKTETELVLQQLVVAAAVAVGLVVVQVVAVDPPW